MQTKSKLHNGWEILIQKESKGERNMNFVCINYISTAK